MSISFIRHRRKAFSISAFLLIAGLISLALFGLNLGVEFAGGTVLHLDLGEGFTLAEVEEVIAPFEEMQGAALQMVHGEAANEGVIIKSRHLDAETEREVVSALRERWPGIGTEELRVESVGAVIGREMTRDAMIALVVAMVAMAIYITLRFEFKFALATLAALLHDVLIVIGIFSILQLEINVTFVAAVLTVFGYSVNDSIVIIDRIRENIRHRRRAEYGEVVDQSIGQNLVRSINTSLTTLMVLASLLAGFLYFIGSLDLIVFIVALIIGVLAGTYSSIFVASPLWLSLKELEFRRARRRPA